MDLYQDPHAWADDDDAESRRARFALVVGLSAAARRADERLDHRGDLSHFGTNAHLGTRGVLYRRGDGRRAGGDVFVRRIGCFCSLKRWNWGLTLLALVAGYLLIISSGPTGIPHAAAGDADDLRPLRNWHGRAGSPLGGAEVVANSPASLVSIRRLWMFRIRLASRSSWRPERPRIRLSAGHGSFAQPMLAWDWR